jgi:hypothetical protein
MNHAKAQFSEPRTNSQYHPQNVPELGKPPKLWARPSRHSFPQSESFTAFKLVVCQCPLFLRKLLVCHALHPDLLPLNKVDLLASREF